MSPEPGNYPEVTVMGREGRSPALGGPLPGMRQAYQAWNTYKLHGENTLSLCTIFLFTW